MVIFIPYHEYISKRPFKTFYANFLVKWRKPFATDSSVVQNSSIIWGNKVLFGL